MKNAFYIVFLLAFSFTNNSCEREESKFLIAPEWSKITALKNGEIWLAGAMAGIQEKHHKDSVTVVATGRNSLGYRRESLGIGYIPLKVGYYPIYLQSYDEITEILATYNTVSDDGDVVEDRYIVLDNENNYLEITSIIENQEINGTFQITFIRDPGDPVDNPSLADTIRFTDGIFRLKIIE